MFIDHSLYKSWSALNYKDANSMVGDISSYYTHILKLAGKKFAEMKKDSYNYIVSVVGIRISKTKEDSLFIEGEGVRVPNSTLVRYDAVLRELMKWIEVEKDGLPDFDVMAVFTRHMGMRSGLALFGSACSKHGSFIVRHRPMGIMSVFVAHELAHTLGVRHDGDLISCAGKDGHIMSSSLYRYGMIEDRTFSNCSRKYMDQFVGLVKRLKSGCFKEGSRPDGEKKDKFGEVWNGIDEQPPGVRFSPDKVCQIEYGKNSHYCSKGDNSWDVCHNFKCYIPGEEGCHVLGFGKAIDGISCANKSWCMGGKCTHDINAPAKNEYCMYGDWRRPLMVNNKKHWCRDVLNKPSLCHHNYVNKLCCASCQSLKSTQPGCPFGDKGLHLKQGSKILGCADLGKFPYFCLEYARSCCKTCSELGYKPDADG